MATEEEEPQHLPHVCFMGLCVVLVYVFGKLGVGMMATPKAIIG
jgi:hypothetical protein